MWRLLHYSLSVSGLLSFRHLLSHELSDQAPVELYSSVQSADSMSHYIVMNTVYHVRKQWISFYSILELGNEGCDSE